MFPDSSNNCPTDNQESRKHSMTTPDRDCNISRLTSKTSHIEKRLVTDGQTNELYLPLTSTVVFKRKQEMLYVPLDFHNNLTIGTLVDSGAYVSATALNVLDTIKPAAPNNIFKTDNYPNFQIQVANSQLKKPLATAKLKFYIGDNTFAEHFVVMKNLIGSIIGLHSMKNNSVVTEATHGLIHFLQLTIQVKLPQK